MKIFHYLILVVMFSASSNACVSSGPKPNDEMINPGDRIGDFLITTRDGDDVIYMTNLHCPFDATTGTETCERPAGVKINVSQGFLPEQPDKTPFEEAWLEQTCEMVIEGHPVNLQAFGYDEWKHPIAGTVRVWNVVISTDRPGTISAQSSGVFDGESWNYTAKINFTEP